MSVFQTTGKIIFGPGELSGLTRIVESEGVGGVALVTDSGVLAAGLAGKAVSQIEAAGASVHIYSDIEPDPAFETLDRAIAELSMFPVEMVVGIGGGSCLDVAKALALVLPTGTDPRQLIGLGQAPHKGLPCIAIPTTAGTGSEVTGIAIFSDSRDHVKKGIVTEHLLPDVAIVDPELTLGLPAGPTAASGMDALTHAVEAYTSQKSNPISDALALEAARLISANLLDAYREPGNLEARAAVMHGSLLAGMSFASAGVSATHALAYPLGGKFAVAHGMANALLLPSVMRFNLPAAKDRYAAIERRLGTSGQDEKALAEAFVCRVSQLASDLGMAKSLGEFGVTEADAKSMAVDAAAISRLMDNNPRAATARDLEAIYLECLHR